MRGVIMMDVIFGCLVVDIASLQYFPYGASTVSVGRHLFLLGGGIRLWGTFVGLDYSVPFGQPSSSRPCRYAALTKKMSFFWGRFGAS